VGGEASVPKTARGVSAPCHGGDNSVGSDLPYAVVEAVHPDRYQRGYSLGHCHSKYLPNPVVPDLDEIIWRLFPAIANEEVPRSVDR